MCDDTQQHNGTGVAQIARIETPMDNRDEPLRLLTLKIMRLRSFLVFASGLLLFVAGGFMLFRTLP